MNMTQPFFSYINYKTDNAVKYILLSHLVLLDCDFGAFCAVPLSDFGLTQSTEMLMSAISDGAGTMILNSAETSIFPGRPW